jgi:hypothetical protein
MSCPSSFSRWAEIEFTTWFSYYLIYYLLGKQLRALTKRLRVVANLNTSQPMENFQQDEIRSRAPLFNHEFFRRLRSHSSLHGCHT